MIAAGQLTREQGQATIALLGVILLIAAAGVVLGSVARGWGAHGDRQRAADHAALAAAREMHRRFGDLFVPDGGGIDVAEYRAAATRIARDVAARNGAPRVEVRFPDVTSFAPVEVEVRVLGDGGAQDGEVPRLVMARAELAPPSMITTGAATGDEYRGPFATRQGQRMRPDVARAFDRMYQAAAAVGVSVVINSGFRSNAEQAVLWARNPDPKWVARPGTSLHRLGTELDLGPPPAYAWLSANALRFGFLKRYGWEAWHFGYVHNAGSASVGYSRGGRAAGKGSLIADDSPATEGNGPASRGGGDGSRGGAIPSFVPAQYAPMISRAAQRWNVGAAVLAAQLYAESNFNPYAGSHAGAQGIAQFMPGTAAAYGLRNPYDAAASIDAQAHLMHDLLRQFGSVPLALAAYNAGPAPVQRCGCVPPYAETRGYVAKILGLLGGAGLAPADGGLTVRLVA